MLLRPYINKFEIVDLQVSDVSSTDFRKTINKEIVSEEVYDYIKKNVYYGANFSTIIFLLKRKRLQ